MLELRLYMAQRITALIMAPLVIGHIAVMIYAVQGGLSAGEILGRTQGSLSLSLIHTPSPRDAHESRMPSSA